MVETALKTHHLIRKTANISIILIFCLALVFGYIYAIGWKNKVSQIFLIPEGYIGPLIIIPECQV